MKWAHPDLKAKKIGFESAQILIVVSLCTENFNKIKNIYICDTFNVLIIFVYIVVFSFKRFVCHI